MTSDRQGSEILPPPGGGSLWMHAFFRGLTPPATNRRPRRGLAQIALIRGAGAWLFSEWRFRIDGNFWKTTEVQLPERDRIAPLLERPYDHRNT